MKIEKMGGTMAALVCFLLVWNSNTVWAEAPEDHGAPPDDGTSIGREFAPSAAPPSAVPPTVGTSHEDQQKEQNQKAITLFFETVRILKEDPKIREALKRAEALKIAFDKKFKSAMAEYAISGESEKTSQLFEELQPVYDSLWEQLESALDQVKKIPALGPQGAENALAGFVFKENETKSRMLAEIGEELKLDDDRYKALVRAFYPGRITLKKMGFQVAEEKAKILVPPGTYLSRLVASQAVPWSEDTPFGDAIPAVRASAAQAEEALGAVKNLGTLLFGN